jgi:hypothetical protein
MIINRSSSGGFYKADNASHPNFFKTSLRSYEVKQLPKKYDFLYYSRNYVKKDVVPIIKKIANNQRLLSARLSNSSIRFAEKTN